MADESNQYHEFDSNVVDEAVSTIRSHRQAAGAEDAGAEPLANLADSGEMYVAAQCISVTVQNNQVCLNLPKPISKKICLTVPSWVPNGTAAEACIGICSKFGIPTGVKLTLSVAGKVIIQKTFGIC